MKFDSETTAAFYLSAKRSLQDAISQLPVEQREQFLMAFQVAWNDVSLESIGSAWVAGVYDAALEDIERAAPSKLN